MVPRNQTVAKRATSVRVRSDLVAATLERALTEEPAALKGKPWREENHEAIAAYNEYVEEHGTFSNGVRSF